MKLLPLLATVAALLISIPQAFAGPPITAKVVYVGTYGDGRFFVALDTQINEPGCPQVRFDIPTSHPQLKNWLAVALTASISGKSIGVQTSGCWNSLPTMTQNADSFFYLQAN